MFFQAMLEAVRGERQSIHKRCKNCKARIEIEQWQMEGYDEEHDSLVCPNCQYHDSHSYINYNHFSGRVRGWNQSKTTLGKSL